MVINDLGMTDDISALLESGKIPEDASVTDIEAILAGVEPDKEAAKADEAAAAAKTDPAAEGGDGSGKTDTTADTTQATDQVAATDGKPNAEPSSAREQQQQEVAAPIAGKNGGTIPYGVLEGTRKSLATTREKLDESERSRAEERAAREKAERERDELLAKLDQRTSAAQQNTRDVQAAATAAGVQGNVETIDVEKLREQFPSEIVDAIAAMQARNEKLARDVQVLQQREANHRASTVQDDIDAVPKLAEWQAADTPVGKAMWNAALELDDALRADPQWETKSRLERFQEIARQLAPEPQSPKQPSGDPGTKPTAAGKSVDDALAAATARAVPISHSGLPAGSPPAQSEAEGLAQLDVTQIADKFAGMSDEQIAAMLARVG